jgi:hypothetical protein
MAEIERRKNLTPRMDHRRMLARHHPSTVFGADLAFIVQGRPLGA